MIKTKHLTISKQKDIIKRVMNMEKFIKSDLNIETIVFACFVARGTGDAVHKNRPSHGLAFHTSGEKEYNFSDGTKLLTKPSWIPMRPRPRRSGARLKPIRNLKRRQEISPVISCCLPVID